jgi:hypothetical protein
VIIVTGSVKAQPATWAQVRELGIEHLQRSRTEPPTKQIYQRSSSAER